MKNSIFFPIQAGRQMVGGFTEVYTNSLLQIGRIHMSNINRVIHSLSI